MEFVREEAGRLTTLILLRPPPLEVPILMESIDQILDLFDNLYNETLTICVNETIEATTAELLSIRQNLEKQATAYLTSLLRRSSEEEMDKISQLLARLCGRIEGGQNNLIFHFKAGTLSIHESNYTECQLGFQTWGSAIVMGQMIDDDLIKVHGQTVLELGSGTGVAGLAASLKGASSVVMTDYHPNVIAIGNKNIVQNDVSNIVYVHLDWRWYEPIKSTDNPIAILKLDEFASVPLQPFETESNHLSTKFSILLAADCIFDLAHSQLIPLVAKKYLEVGGKFHLMIPQRPPFKKEVEDFESKMLSEGWILEQTKLIQKSSLAFRYYVYVLRTNEE